MVRLQKYRVMSVTLSASCKALPEVTPGCYQNWLLSLQAGYTQLRGKQEKYT